MPSGPGESCFCRHLQAPHASVLGWCGSRAEPAIITVHRPPRGEETRATGSWERIYVYCLHVPQLGRARGPGAAGLSAGQGCPFPSPQTRSGILQFALKPRAEQGQGQHVGAPRSEILQGVCAVARISRRARRMGTMQSHTPRRERWAGVPGKSPILVVGAGSVVPTPVDLWCGATLCGLLLARPSPQGLGPRKTPLPESLLLAQRPDPKSCSRARCLSSLSRSSPPYRDALGGWAPAGQRLFPAAPPRTQLPLCTPRAPRPGLRPSCCVSAVLSWGLPGPVRWSVGRWSLQWISMWTCRRTLSIMEATM